MFFCGMTKGDVLRYAIAFALRRSRKIIRGLKEGLTEEERFAVAERPVAAKPGGAGGEASINMIDLELDGRHPPTPRTTPSVL